MSTTSPILNNDIDNFNRKNHYVIGIGFSAGGLEALNLFFDHTPVDSASYIIIQHLPSDYRSHMGTLLAKHSKLKIYEIQHDMFVEQSCVYLMPERKNVTVKSGRFVLTEASNIQPNSAIDIFLDSLATDQGNKSIGVILSGSGTDGSKGIASIKHAGGMVIAQSPESSKFDGMPRSAIETGYVNSVLTPEKMPAEIQEYITQNTLFLQLSGEISEKDDTTLKQILNLIKEKTPQDFTNYKRPTILRRILRRVVQNNLKSLQDYYEFLGNNAEEIEVLSKEFLISVTKFFRDQEAFEVIREKVIPE